MIRYVATFALAAAGTFGASRASGCPAEVALYAALAAGCFAVSAHRFTSWPGWRS